MPGGTGGQDPHLPANVSPVYYKLTRYVALKFPSTSEAIRHSILALAYTAYCEDKKKQIQTNIEIHNMAPQQPAVSQAFRAFDNEKQFDKYCDEAQKLIRVYIDDDVRETLKEVAKELEPSFFKLIWVHFWIAIAVSFLVAILPILAAVSGSSNAKTLLHGLGDWLIRLSQ